MASSDDDDEVMEDAIRILGTILQTASIVLTALFAIAGLEAWRRQLLGKRRMEVADARVLNRLPLFGSTTVPTNAGIPFKYEFGIFTLRNGGQSIEQFVELRSTPFDLEHWRERS